MVYTLYMVSGVFPAWNAQRRRTDQRFFHVTPWSAMERLSWNAVNVAYRLEKNNLRTPLRRPFQKLNRDIGSGAPQK